MLSKKTWSASSGAAAGRSVGLSLWRRLDQWAPAMRLCLHPPGRKHARPEVPRAPLRWTKPEPHTGPGVRFCQWVSDTVGYTHPRCGLSATPGTRRRPVGLRVRHNSFARPTSLMSESLAPRVCDWRHENVERLDERSGVDTHFQVHVPATEPKRVLQHGQATLEP
jgi:hypothetical protein